MEFRTFFLGHGLQKAEVVFLNRQFSTAIPELALDAMAIQDEIWRPFAC
jgi:hypothetical protein